VEKQYNEKATILHSAVGLVSTVAGHNPELAQAAGLQTRSLLYMLQGALLTLKVCVSVCECVRVCECLCGL
jgi:hypothetical protein